METMTNISWIFDGIGTVIISFILGLISGSGITYKITKKKSIKQAQKAGNHSSQSQVGDINDR
jgi:hypothetical protein